MSKDVAVPEKSIVSRQLPPPPHPQRGQPLTGRDYLFRKHLKTCVLSVALDDTVLILKPLYHQ